MAGTLELSVKVLNISPKVTLEELCTFFSFCGTVDDIKLQREGDKDKPYSAIVTFKQPYAFQTALLLDDALLVDRRVRISQMENPTSVPINSQSTGKKKKKSQGDKPPPPQQYSVTEAVAKRGHEVLNYARELDEKYKMREAGREIVQHTRSAISAAEHTAGRMGTAIVHSSCFSKSALWLAGVLDRASKYAAELGNQKLRDDTNSRKKK